MSSLIFGLRRNKDSAGLLTVFLPGFAGADLQRRQITFQKRVHAAGTSTVMA